MTPRIDHRAAQTPVRRQGPRPTCAAFATTAAHEWMAGNAPDLSEECALWAAKRVDARPPTDATSVKAALTGIGNDGQAMSADWPYGRPHWTNGPPNPAADPARRRRPGPWRSIATTIAGIEVALHAGAVILSVSLQPTIWRDAADDGFVDHDDAAPTFDSHAVLGIGIARDDSAEGDAQDWVMFKNSWGDRWGDAGYGYMSAAYLGYHLLAAHTLEPA